jgi:hypothetical protein
LLLDFLPELGIARVRNGASGFVVEVHSVLACCSDNTSFTDLYSVNGDTLTGTFVQYSHGQTIPIVRVVPIETWATCRDGLGMPPEI